MGSRLKDALANDKSIQAKNETRSTARCAVVNQAEVIDSNNYKYYAEALYSFATFSDGVKGYNSSFSHNKALSQFNR